MVFPVIVPGSVVAQPLEKPYPSWHTLVVQNPTLSGTLLENLTLCGTEVGQNGTLPVLAYVYCRQWSYLCGWVRAQFVLVRGLAKVFGL